jgi:predicted secreted protein
VGEPLTVELKGGGGTGFVWQPQTPLPETVQLDKEYIVPDPDQGMGGTGKEKLTFMFTQPGQYELDFGFVSPAGDRVAKNMKLKFEIK